MHSRLTRRNFLSTTATGGAGLLILRNSASARSYQANQKLNVALIGVGGRGAWFVETIPKMENVVGMCDVDPQKLEGAFRQWTDGAQRWAASPREWERQAAEAYQRLLANRPASFQDFRVMLDKLGDGIDAVVVATPDHTHAVASAAAIRAGKHVFCEKPLTRTLHESRALRDLARRYAVATSMGNQGTASGPFRRALELIRNGALGEVREVHVWNTGGGADRQQPPAGTPPLPPGLAWDLWLGPARERPYHPEWMKRNLWRDFGTCQLGNWASHTANLAFMALKVHELWLSKTSPSRPPLRVTARCSGLNRLSFPRWEHVQWEIPARAEFPPITFNWYNGPVPEVRQKLAPLITDPAVTEDVEASQGLEFAGAAIVGTTGRIHTTGHNATFRLLPSDEFQSLQRERPEEVAASRGHETDFFLACRGGKPAWANFDYASALNEFLMLGNLATQFEGPLEFDPQALKIVNNPLADAALRCEYRPGWSLD